jgi:Carbohydrate binding domain (family 11)
MSTHPILFGALVGLSMMGCIDASQRMAQCPTGPAAAGDAPAVSACSKGIRPAEDGLIDDFEDDDNQVTKAGGRDGYWFLSHDPNGSTIGPAPLKWSPGGADGSSKAVHVSGQTSSENGAWGSQLGTNLLSEGMYDASKYGGISFKAKIGANSTKKVRFKVGDVNTHPDGHVCKTCWNLFGKDMNLTTDWKEYTITFAEMKQEAGWGEPHPSIEPSKIMSINWSVGPGQAFDLWVDDLKFFECQ